MHHAPAVTYPAGPSRVARRGLLLAWLAGAAAILAWALQADVPGWRHAGGGLAVLLSGLAAALAWKSQGVGELRWDGAHWQAPGIADAAAAVRLDLQGHLLLQIGSRHGAAGARQWFWAERSSCPQRWGDLRRAVYSRAMPEPPPAGGAEGASPK